MAHIHSYSKVFTIGHKWVLDVFDGPVYVEEKIDGSQISFGIINGELSVRSNGADIYLEAAPKMFNKAIETILSLKDELIPNLIYRGEYLQKPKHNTLAYERTPKKNIIIFDISDDKQNYWDYADTVVEADRLGLETVPLFYFGKIDSLEQLKKYLENDSVLGGQKVEGVVVKNYSKFTDDKKVMMAKYVSKEFQEKHQGEWKKSNPTRTDVINNIVETYKTDARWKKAIQHLAETGNLDGSPKDIGPLIKAVKDDVLAECEDEIKHILFTHFWGQIGRMITAGLPEWYKEYLAEKSME